MPDTIDRLIANNRSWAAEKVRQDPDFFRRLLGQQAPDFLWIGCSDSRVPANEIVGLDPGELFVHRNVGNLVVPSDINCLSVLQFAVDILGVEHVIVCGHYGCGAVRAALDDRQLGLCDHWIGHIGELREAHHEALQAIEPIERRADALCELNVAMQVRRVASTPIARKAWVEGRPLAIHGWIYALGDGLVRDLGCSITGDGDYDTLPHLDFVPSQLRQP